MEQRDPKSKRVCSTLKPWREKDFKPTFKNWNRDKPGLKGVESSLETHYNDSHHHQRAYECT